MKKGRQAALFEEEKEESGGNEAEKSRFSLKMHYFSAHSVTFLHHRKPQSRSCLFMVHQAISDSSCELAASSSPASCS